jgi:regulator of protease activity HflC (stomatin/prohibitin superfamily)
VYETAVFSPDRPPDWAFSFSAVHAGDVSRQLAEMRLDELSAPEDPGTHPLREIEARGLETARSSGTQQGVDVLNMTMGAIEMPQELSEQIISNWQVEWQRRARVLEAEGEAKATQLTEEARAEAQANMIQALTEGFRIAVSDSTSKDVAGQVIALRFIDTLEALMQGGPGKAAKDKPPDLGLVVS